MDEKQSDNLIAPKTSSQIGDVVAGKYEITSVIGSGGFGVVYKARQLNLDRDIALKVMHSWVVADSESVVRFEREGRILTGLQHKNIVALHSFGVDDAKRCYMSMQYLNGQTLSVVKSQGKMQWQRAAHIAIQICDALAVAHEHGVVHRDLKPQNVMLVEGPEPDFVKILDFGLCGALPDTMTDFQKLTQTGEVLGSVHYMAPEVAQGLRADRRSDIYSVGCILYECLSGRPPLDADDAVAVMFLQTGTMPARLKEGGNNKDLPDQLELAVFKSMQKDPRERFQTMTEFGDALRAIMHGKVPAIDARDIVLPSSKTTRKNPTRLLLIAACALIAMIVVAVPLFRSGKTDDGSSQYYLLAFQQADAEIQQAMRQKGERAIPTYSRAARLLEHALREAPPDWPRREEATGMLCSCYGRADMPGELVRLITSWHPSSVQSETNLADAYWYLGEKAMSMKNYPLAERYGNQMLAESEHVFERDRDGFRMRALSLIGESQLRSNRLPAAVDYFERAVRITDNPSVKDCATVAKVELARIYLGEYGTGVPQDKSRALALLKGVVSPPFFPHQEEWVKDAEKLIQQYGNKGQ